MAVMSVGLALTALAADTKPNIVYIVADDLGWKDVGFNGCTDIKTPNIDKLCRGGREAHAVLCAAHVHAHARGLDDRPLSIPLRPANRRHPLRLHLRAGHHRVAPAAGLKEAGYKTAIIGKWHLGHADKKFWPRQRGFDYQYGAMIGELDYFTHEEHGVLDWYRDNKPVREKGYTTTLIGNDAVKYIKAQDPPRPSTSISPSTPRTRPIRPPRNTLIATRTSPTPRAAPMPAWSLASTTRSAASSPRSTRRACATTRSSSSTATTAARRNAMFAGVMADISKIKIPCDNGPYREGKGTLFEGACRVCACANWPGHIKPGSTVDGMIHAVDLYPTLAALAGASTAKCKPLDGLNVWDTIAEGKPSPRTEFVYNIEPFRAALRQGDWKLIWRTLLPSSVDLYNLAQDPSETEQPRRGQPREGRRDAAAPQRAGQGGRQAALPRRPVQGHHARHARGTCPSHRRRLRRRRRSSLS